VSFLRQDERHPNCLLVDRLTVPGVQLRQPVYRRDPRLGQPRLSRRPLLAAKDHGRGHDLPSRSDRGGERGDVGTIASVGDGADADVTSAAESDGGARDALVAEGGSHRRRRRRLPVRRKGGRGDRQRALDFDTR